MDLSKDLDPVVHEKMKKNLVYVSCFSIVMLFAGLSSAYIVSMGDAFWLETALPSAFWWSTGCITLSSLTFIVAIGAANVFLDHGLMIPDELSIAGFGNILSSEHYRVPLTTIRQPKFRMGMAAFDSMLKLITKKQVEPQRMIGEVLFRKSTGPAKIKKP